MQEERSVINYCLSNITPDIRALLRGSEHCVIEDFCLQRCGHCHQGPFLVVDGELMTGRSHRKLLEALSPR